MALFKKNKEEKKEEKRKSVFGRIVTGLKKTQQKFIGAISSLVLGRKVDDELIDEIEEILYLGDIGNDMTAKLIDNLRSAWKKGDIEDGEQIIPFMKNYINEILTSKSNKINWSEKKPTVILVVGVNGTGKTTSIGKLAWRFKQEGKKVLIGAGDTFRAAAENQLRIWAEERIECGFFMGEVNMKPDAVAYKTLEKGQTENYDVILFDTAGRLHTQKNLMQQLEKIKRVMSSKIEGAPHEVLLVLDATTGQNALNQAQLFKDTAGVTGLMLAKLDSTAKGGVVLAIHEKVEIPVKFIGIGEQKEDLAEFDAKQFADALFITTESD
jgi:fused signal recognition particle receptor